jgi:hypothetical protein
MFLNKEALAFVNGDDTIILDDAPVTMDAFFKITDKRFACSMRKQSALLHMKIFAHVFSLVEAFAVSEGVHDDCFQDIFNHWVEFDPECMRPPSADKIFRTDSRLNWNVFEWHRFPSRRSIIARMAYCFWEMVLVDADPSLVGSVDWRLYRKASVFPKCVHRSWVTSIDRSLDRFNHFLSYLGVPKVPHHLKPVRDTKKYRQTTIVVCKNSIY